MTAAPDFDGGVTAFHWRYSNLDMHGRKVSLWTCPRCAGRGWVHHGDLWRTVGLCPACQGRAGFTPWTLAVVLARREGTDKGARRAARGAWYRRIQAVLSERTLEGRAVRVRSRTAIELLERMAEVFATS